MYEKLLAGLEPATFCLPQKSPDFRGPRRRNHHSLRLIPTCFSKIKRARFVSPFYFGATGRTRTGDLLFAPKIIRFLGTPKGEPAGLSVECKPILQRKKSPINRLFSLWSYWPDSNRRPIVCPKNHPIFGDPGERTSRSFG